MRWLILIHTSLGIEKEEGLVKGGGVVVRHRRVDMMMAPLGKLYHESD